ncbi:MAG: hypothetical protein VXZ72_00970 [Chlamydiota bacterium]|nr:hypothetical protein [Chlamydiota bacterium]
MAQPLLRPAGILEDEYGLELVTLDILCLQKYGHTYIDWDSEALKLELMEDFGKLGDMTWERIQAARILHKNDIFWKEWEVFEKVTAAIIGEHPIFSYSQPPDADEIAVALDTAAKVADNNYSEDVKGYIAAACLADGMWYLDDPLDVALDALLEHDRKKGIERDFELVASKLQKTDTYIDPPESAIDIQVNHVLGVNAALKEQRSRVAKQLAMLPRLVNS